MKDIRELLKEERYQTRKYESGNSAECKAFEKLNNFGDTFTLFDDLLEELKRPATQSEYVEEYLMRVKEFMFDERYMTKSGARIITKTYENKTFKSQIKWNDELEKTVLARASRTYTSLLVEYTTEFQFKKIGSRKEFTVHSDRHIDTVFGADLVLTSQKGQVYVHVLLDSFWSRKAMAKKAKYKGVLMVDDKKYLWERDWSKYHVELFYLKQANNYSTEVINGNPILREEYLEDCAEVWFTDTENVEKHGKENSLNKFYDWLDEKNVFYLPF